MAGLFDLPTSRNNKGADKIVVNSITNKKSASIVVKGGGLLEKISSINALVENKLGKYRDDYTYFMAKDEELFKDYIYNTIQTGYVAMDTETTGLNPISDKIVGMSLYSKGQKGLYIPIHHKSYVTGIEVEGQLDPKLIKEQLQRLVDAGVRFKEYNAKFDTRVVKNQLGIYIPCWYDAHLAAMLLNENEPHGLKTLHSKYVLNGKEDEFAFGRFFNEITFDLVPIKIGYMYAARDAVDTDELVDWQLPYLTPDNPICKEYGLEKVSNVFWNIEMPCIEVLADMEDTGIAFDTDLANTLSEKYHKQLEDNLSEFYRVLDMYKVEIDTYIYKHPNNKLDDPISISSPTQLAILFYDILKIEPPDTSKPRGTGSDILEKIDNPLCKAILDYRATAKLLTTYVDKLPECINPKTGRIHCNYNQYGAKTGRMSSDNPNMQNIPSKNHDIRQMFVASPGNVLMSSDYSQQEPKVMTVMCQDSMMIEAYQNGKDLYASIASLAFNKPYEECLEFRPDGTTNKEGKERRSQAKTILLGILYGRGLNSVAEQLHTTKRKAQEIQDRIFKGFPAIKQFEDDTKYMAEQYGFVTTFWGRKRRLPDMQLPEFEFKWKDGFGDVDPLAFDVEVTETEVPDDIKRKYISKLHRNPFKKKPIYAEAEAEGVIIIDNGGKIADATRQCVNSRIQGSAADLTKLAAIEIYNNQRLRELGFKLLVPVHDEFIAECPRENAKECAELFSKCMSDAARDMNIPISTDVEITERWYGEPIKMEDL
jgi:DNA polymerase I-like protein with 3'-5' exonuclease and polymerase domains